MYLADVDLARTERLPEVGAILAAALPGFGLPRRVAAR
jgi:hypothetical protein